MDTVNDDFVPDALLEIENEQCKRLSTIAFSDNVCYIYSPLNYARETHEFYVRNYCRTKKCVLFLGMNPGPFGMAQNGVPFGDSYYVNNWLKIQGKVFKPLNEHPKRQIYGLSCPRSEVSGSRFWSFLQEICGEPEKFFRYCYVHNYCPISMMTASGKNITPPELKAIEKKALINICDESLYKVLKLLNIKLIVGIGKFAEDQASKVILKNNISDIIVTGIMHPSPINPAANKGWKDCVYQKLESSGVLQHYML